MRKKYSRLTDGEKLSIIKSYGAGTTMEDVANQIGVSINTVFKILKQYNVPTRTPNYNNKVLTTEDLINIRKRIDSGELQYMIAVEYGVHESTVSVALKRNNI